ncbi:MAG: HAD family hydrolase [Sulfurovum sp.]|nr:HAD family hydrolase [Sulfurovum sp.]
MKKSLIIFDMDGTLVDSSHTIANSINHVRANIGLNAMPNHDIISKINDHTINPAKYFYGIDTYEPMHEQWFTEYYSQNHDQELVLYDGIYELLGLLKSMEIGVALATNAYRVSTLESLTHLNIYHFFDAIACADDVERSKPFPDMLHKVLHELDTHSQKSIFVGDGSRDENAAKSTPMDYLMVDWGFTEHAKDREKISSVDELKGVLLENIA